MIMRLSPPSLRQHQTETPKTKNATMPQCHNVTKCVNVFYR